MFTHMLHGTNYFESMVAEKILKPLHIYHMDYNMK